MKSATSSTELESIENSPDILDLEFQSIFPPGKFKAPRLDAAFHMFRNVALRPLITPITRNQNVILIEARAGQGKSILAAQFLHHIQAKYAWMQVAQEDRDPVVFISAVFTALLNTYPELEQSTVYQTISKGQVVAEEAGRLSQILMSELIPLTKESFYLVIDDLHIVNEEPFIGTFINMLIRHSIPDIRFILISRTTIELDKKLAKNALRLDNHALALTPNDTAQLFATIFKKSLPTTTIADLHQQTEGWVMGLILANHAIPETQTTKTLLAMKSLLSSGPNQFSTYFQDELLESLMPMQRHALLSLALLDVIPLGLAEIITSMDDTKTFLEQLVAGNYFLRRIEDDPPCYNLHHLFQEYLRHLTQKELSQNEHRIVWAKAGHWHWRRKRHEPALKYYLNAQAYGMAEKILREVGLQLLATNRFATLQEALAKIPPQVVHAHAWLSFFIASIYVRHNPFESRTYLEQARQQFIADDETLGELMATTTLIMFHAGIDCRFKDGQPLLQRAEALYHVLAEQLSVAARIQSAYAIVYGLCYFEGQTQRANEYITTSLRLAKAHDLDDAILATAVARGLIRSIEGNWTLFRQEIEQAFYLLKSPRVSGMTKLGLLFQELTLLGMEGDFTTFNHYRELLTQFVNSNLLANSVFGPLLVVSNISRLLFEGRLDEALQEVQKAMTNGGSGQTAHMQSQYHAYLAYILALQNQPDQAIAAAEKSADLRLQAGGAYHSAINEMILGGVYAQLKSHRKAEIHLGKAIAASKTLGEKFIRAGAYAHRAYLRLDTDKQEEALSDIRQLLQAMRSGQYVQFYTFNPILMRKVLTSAVIHDVEADLARSLARDRLGLIIAADGQQIPILEIVTLGDLELRIDGQTKASFADFTTGQRELLSLLASAPKTGLSHEIIQVDFWPESAPAKVRSRLDNLLARLRKTLNTLLAPYPASNYIAMEKGFVRLQNCRIDAHCFMHEAKQGMTHVKKLELRQASNAFFRSHTLYHGPFLPGVDIKEQASLFRDDLQQLFLESATQWTHILSDSARIAEAIEVCRSALQYDPTHQALTKTLYHLLTQINEPILTRQVIANYQEALSQDGFSPHEIDEIMNDFWRGE